MRKQHWRTICVWTLTAALLAGGACAAAADEEIAAEIADEVVEETEVVEEPGDEEYLLDDGYEDETSYEETGDGELPDGVEDVAAEEAEAFENDDETVVISDPSLVEDTVEAPDENQLWTYAYAGAPNVYLRAVCDWIGLYHADRAPLDTGMIPSFNIVKCVDDDRNDIRLYGQFLISDYAWDGQTLALVADELLTGCMHLQQLNETDYVVSSVEVLDPGARISSAEILSGGSAPLARGLIAGEVTREEREQAIRDFAAAQNLDITAWQDESGALHELYGAEPSPDYVGKTVEAAYAEQIITVGATSGSNAVLQLHKKQEDGSWLCVLDVPALIGREGLGKTCEGDARTPVGVFGVTEAFGIEADPGAKIPYTQCDETHYWVGDSASEKYNRLVSTAEYTSFDVEDSEHIADETYAYRYAMNLDYNKDGEPYAGSAIFVHCFKEQRFFTGGCVAVPAEAMVTLLTEIDDGVRVIIDTAENLETQYLNADAKREAAGAALAVEADADADAE